jgi:hypothetical protein
VAGAATVKCLTLRTACRPGGARPSVAWAPGRCDEYAVIQIVGVLLIWGIITLRPHLPRGRGRSPRGRCLVG